jgi:hypothetical protein
MENSSRDTPTNLSPDRLHPSQVDDSERGADARAGDWLVMLPAAGVACVVCLPLFASLALLRAWRKWRGKADGS